MYSVIVLSEYTNSTLGVEYNMSEHGNKQTMNKPSYQHKDMQTHTKQKTNIQIQCKDIPCTNNYISEASTKIS